MSEIAWPPFGPNERLYTVIGHREGKLWAEDWVDSYGDKQTRRWQDPNETVRGHYTEAGEAEVEAAKLIGDGWRVTVIVPG